MEEIKEALGITGMRRKPYPDLGGLEEYCRSRGKRDTIVTLS
jgi:hypothetical protein